jgi:diketogulonate reductase-like aldo/keto reductase
MVAAVPHVPKEAHIIENLDVFDLTLNTEDIQRISVLRSCKLCIAEPPERTPKWDVDDVETVA